MKNRKGTKRKLVSAIDEVIKTSGFDRQCSGEAKVVRKLNGRYFANLNHLQQDENIRALDIAAKFKDVMELHYQDIKSGKAKYIFRVQDYASSQCLHPNYLNTIIKLATGKAIGRWIIEKNILVAKCLLNCTDCSVKAIANSLHFADTAHFCNYFKKYTNCTPSTFRKQPGYIKQCI